MSETAIRINSVSKNFKLPHDKNTSIKSAIVHFYRRNKTYEMQEALKDITLEIKQGEFFGIVGKNGSGKSTLLKILAGIYIPTSGSVEINGKLTPFIELGVGFNPELTGRENVYLNGALLGFNRKEMRAKYKEIVEFSELQRFMDQKLKNYSSGMQVRLAFSIAIKSQSEILIFDEVLAVGDEAFQRKCLDVFEQYKADKQTVVLVTHDMETVRKYCTRALVLDDGKILKIGHPHQVASTYTALNLTEVERDIVSRSDETSENSLGLSVRYENEGRKSTSIYKCGDRMHILLDYEKRSDYKYLVINIYKRSGEHISGFRIAAKSGTADVEVGALFSKGKYYTIIQAINDDDEAVGDAIIGPEFVISTVKAPGRPGWSGLVPIEYKIFKQ